MRSKKKMQGRRGHFFSGALLFFGLVAAIIQIAVMTYDYIIQRTDDNLLIAVLMLVIVIVLASLCTLFDYFRRKHMVERPVRKILEATERIASGDFSVRLETIHPYGKYDEFDVIMENVNTLAAELGKSEILKTDFISNVSHELKTPLSVIQSYTVMLADSELDSETREKYVETVTGATKRLSSLVSNILRLNKLENQEIREEYEEIDLAELLAESALHYETAIEKKQLSLECDLDDVRLFSSKSYLEIVFHNLISNAIKFSDEGGEVAISLKKTENGALIKVKDTGCGISPETGKHIFEKFYQGDTSHAGEGNGLGLALVKRVIDILGGEISVESELGRGSTFTVVLKDIDDGSKMA